MSFEIFSGFDSKEQAGDPEAFEKLQARMRENRRHIQAIQKQEKRQKQQEEKLIQILLRFIQRKQHADLVALIARLLEENLPASFIVSLILLGHEEVQQEVGISLKIHETEGEPSESRDLTQRAAAGSPTFTPTSLPHVIRLEIELWGRNMFSAAEGYARRILEKGRLSDGMPKPIIVDTATYVLDEFLRTNGLPEDFFHLRDFLQEIFRSMFRELERLLQEQQPELLEG